MNFNYKRITYQNISCIDYILYIVLNKYNYFYPYSVSQACSCILFIKFCERQAKMAER